MNDENDENDHGHFIAFPFAQPSEEEVERAKMEHTQNAHEVRAFFDGLSEEQLRKLSGLFGYCAHSDGEAATYYMGVITGIMDFKFKVCMGCGNDHEKALHEMSGPVEDPEPAVEGNSVLVKGSERYNKTMDIFGMEQDDDGSDRVMCINCGKWYENLQDRTLRPPGKSGCPGCVQKEKWG
jgi:hypothetical protein